MSNIQKYYYIFPILFIITILIFLFEEYSKEKTLTIDWTNNFKTTFTLSKTDKQKLLSPTILPSTGLQPQKITIQIFSLQFIIKKHHITANKDTLLLEKVIPIDKQKGFSLILTTTEDKIINIDIISNKHTTNEEYIITIKNYSNTNILLPFSITLGSNIVILNNQIDIFSQSLNTYLTVSPNIEIKENNFHLKTKNGIIRLSNKKNKKIFNTIALEIDKLYFPYINLEPIVQEYIDKSYHAWTDSRYRRSTGTWKYPNSIYTFNEDALVSTYSEAIKRNELAQHKLFLERVALLHQHRLSWKSLPILGTNNTDIQNISFPTHLTNSIHNKNTEILKTYLLDHSFFQHAYTFYQDDMKTAILQLLQSFSFINCSPELAASLLYQSHSSPWKEANTIIQQNKEILEIILLNNFVPIQITASGISLATQHISLDNKNILLLLSNSNNQLDSMATLLGAKYFITQKKEPLIQLGKKLIHNLLLQSDYIGFFPRWFIVNTKDIIPSGYIAPESIYSLITSNKYYPSISINTSLHILSVIPIDYTYKNKQLVLSIPTVISNITIYLYIWNKNIPSRITAFDAVWKGNYKLDGLLRGVQYNSKTNTIMIKNKSKNKQETISIQFK